MIKPTIGRIVWVWDRRGTADPKQPEPALICYVHDDRHVNVAGYNAQGHTFRFANLTLAHGDEDKPVVGERAEWMPYQAAAAKQYPVNLSSAAPSRAHTSHSTAAKAVESSGAPPSPTMALGTAGTSSGESTKDDPTAQPLSPSGEA